MQEMKNPNLPGIAKIIKEVTSDVKSAIESDSKETQESIKLYQKSIDNKSNVSNSFCQCFNKELDCYKIALEKSTSEEERINIMEKIEKTHENAVKIVEKSLDTDNTEENAKEEREKSRKFKMEIIVGIVTLAFVLIGSPIINKSVNSLNNNTKR